MKIKNLLVVAGLALCLVARAQNNATPAPAQDPSTPVKVDPAAVPATPPSNAAPAAPIANPAAVLPASSISTNSPGAVVEAGANTNSANEVVPLILIDDVPLVDAVKTLTRQAGLNAIADPKLLGLSNQPNVSLRLENVTPQDALLAVLETYNLQIVHDPRIKVSRITVKDPKAEEPLFSEIMQLKYAQPTNLIDILKRTISPRGQVLGDPRTSQLIIVATEKEFPAVRELVAKLDTATRQVLIEAQIWETAKNPRSVKGIDWAGTLEAQNVTFGNGRLLPDENRTFSETRTPGDSKVVNIPGKGPTTVRSGSSSETRTTYVPYAGGMVMDTAKGFHPATAFLNADGLRAVVSFLNSENDTEIVATPRAVTMDNEQASLSITRAFPIFKVTPGSANSPAGAEITYTNLGTILRVTPHIAANSNISLRVMPEVSDIAAVDRQILNGFENTANIYAIRRMDTHVMIPSGSTLVLGGLISDRMANAQNKVPILGDAPGLGYFFRKSSKSRDKSNLMVFVTPSVVNDMDFQLAANASDYLQTKKPERPEPKESFWDSAKPHDWTKPKNADETKAAQ